MQFPTAPLDVNNIQGDIWPGLPKKFETYYFFRIIDDTRINEFRKQLGQLVPLISTAAQVIGNRERINCHKRTAADKSELLKLSGVNIAFSQSGLGKLGLGTKTGDEIGDEPFKKGMLKDISTLKDQLDKWLLEFQREIHGLIVIAGDSQATVGQKLVEVKKIFGGKQNSTIQAVKRIDGNVRPGMEAGHEHFGYLDGVSQPAILGLDENLHRGQETVRQGIIFLGREGDEEGPSLPPPRPKKRIERPKWAWDGSFLCFRYLSQLVPEFDSFIEAHNPPDAEKDLLGAQLVGRWKSGAPVDLVPEADDPKLGADTSQNDNFRYTRNSQERCPYVAHTRKTNPRSDLDTDGIESHRILRRGIPFGPEVTEKEKEAKKTDTNRDRGLLFKAYQSQIGNGFRFLQQVWCNNPAFPPTTEFETSGVPGFDPIIGQAGSGGARAIDIQGGNDPAGKINLPREWVVSRGGEYFFSPSISGLKEFFAKPTSESPSRGEL